MYIPVLNEGLPPGWIVSLADNPGFGEARECITQVANASMVVSSAYIYLMHPGSVSGTAAAEFFKELHAKDAGNFMQLLFHFSLYISVCLSLSLSLLISMCVRKLFDTITKYSHLCTADCCCTLNCIETTIDA